MNEEFNKVLKQDLLDQFQEAKDELEERIEKLEELLENKRLTEEQVAVLEEAVRGMNQIVPAIDKIMSIGREEDVDFNDIEFFEGTRYENRWDKQNEKLADINDTISDIEGLKAGIVNSSGGNPSKYTSLAVSRLNQRIARLKKKQGRIQEKQRKILSQRIANLLKGKMDKFKSTNKLSDKLIKNDEKIIKADDKKAVLEENRDDILTAREALNESGGLLNKFTSLRLWFVEKITVGRIKALKSKQGVLANKEKHIVKRGVGPGLISRMKERVNDFMYPSLEWENEHVHHSTSTNAPKETPIPEKVRIKSQPVTPAVINLPDKLPPRPSVDDEKVNAVCIDGEVYEIDKDGLLVQSLGRREFINLNRINFVDEETKGHTR